jgi:PAS domain S-box-containing protein
MVPNGSFQAVIEGLYSSPIALSGVIDRVPLGVLLLDSGLRLLTMNHAAEALTGFQREEVQGIPCRDILRSSFCPRDCPARTTSIEGKSACREGDIVNRDRRKIPIRLTSASLRDSSGKILGHIETVEDLRPYQQLDTDLKRTFGYGSLLGTSRKMEAVFKLLPIIAATDSSVLITGETGTGKDLLAETIHEASERARHPFIKVNCGALPENLLESELFGHKKGAFTGAVIDKPGRMRLAHQGTLYLTEIGDLPLVLQVKLLTFLDDRIIYPLGGTKGFHTDVRIIAATNQNVDRMVRSGDFRKDLLFRLKVVQLHLPPLRDREGDVALLMDHFLQVFASRFGKKIKGFAENVRMRMLAYPFPGNVRELKNIIEYAANVCLEDQITPEHLPTYLLESSPAPPAADLSYETGDLPSEQAQPKDWLTIERQLIVDALIKAKGRRGRAASILGWARSTLWRKMKQYDLDAEAI